MDSGRDGVVYLPWWWRLIMLAVKALPERFFNEAGSSGDGIDIHPIDRQRFEEELDKYYRIRGLNGDGCFDDAGFLDKQP